MDVHRFLSATHVALLAGLAMPVRVAPRALLPHDIHLTHSRVVVDGRTVAVRVRLFRDDLEAALRSRTGQPSLELTSAQADSAFGRYAQQALTVRANGTVLVGRVVQSGKDPDVTDNEMWWYLVEYTATAPITRLGLRAGFLFERFEDQRNIVALMRLPGESRHSFYFVRDDPKEQELRW